MLFFGAGKRACAAVSNKQESSQVTALSSVIMPAAPKNGNLNEGERSEPRREDSTKCSAAPKPKTAKGRFGPNGDLTKGSVSRFLVTLF